MVALIKPPITTRASGLCVSEPIPVEIAAGSKPMAAISAVMTTGLMRDDTPVWIDSSNESLFLRFFLKTETNMTPF